MDHPSANDLESVPLLAGVASEARAALAPWFEVEQHEPGHVLIREGGAGYAFYVVAAGQVAVSHDGRDVATLGPGDFFGEISILGDGRRTATVTAREPTTVWVLFGTSFRVMQSEHPDVADALLDAMAARLASD